MSALASSKGHTITRASERSTMPSIRTPRSLDPCGATASMFLYAQGPSVVCCHHDSLAIERRFTGHRHEVLLLAIDNQSEKDAGRLAVSYDSNRTVIIWDLMTGNKLHEFQFLQARLTAVAWMRNGNVAFGNEAGTIVLYELETQQHISFRTQEQTAITALAPSDDLRTFAVGYHTGSLFIVILQPSFNILHNLTTSGGPSPIVNLAWHASSSRQKSEMLAVQKDDGDLRVWSVAKAYGLKEQAKVVRILRKAEALENGPNWMSWSKNGRVIQFSDNETLSWDVRTKQVTFDSIPTLEHVRGMALYGPRATLFTVGPNGTAQQFDLNSPSIMVANVQHPTSHLPPSPPNSIGITNQPAHSVTTIHNSECESSVPMKIAVSESDEDHLSPFARISRGHAPHSGNETYESASPVSSKKSLSSPLSKSSADSRTPGRHESSLRSQNTYFSAGASLRPSTVGRQQEFDNYSMAYSLGTTSVPSVASSPSRHRPFRVLNEVPRTLDDNKVHDLFKFTRTRLSDIPYKHPMNADNSRLTNEDLQKQILSTIFGWHSEVEDLIRDEMSRHPSSSPSRILLAKWLGDIETDLMAGGAQSMTSSDWMLLALSGIGSETGQRKIGRAYVQRLLKSNNVHVAVTIMLGMGDHNDAIEIYVSQKRYMEALILTCLAFPGMWERQAAIIRKWGEWAVQHDQQLAIRCFACTDQKSTEPWRSPSVVQLNFQNIATGTRESLGSPLSPPGVQRGPQRTVAKSSSLKLITSFGDAAMRSSFNNQNDDGQTPIAAGVTPIAGSAISPCGSYGATTAFLRPSNNSRPNTPTSARPSDSTTSRGRLPSIGKAPNDINRSELAKQAEKYKSRQGHSRVTPADYDNTAVGSTLPRAATASPMIMRDRCARVVTDYQGDEQPHSPDYNIMARMQESKGYSRNGSQERIHGGRNLQLQPLGQPISYPTSPEQSAASSTRFHWPTRRRGPGSVASSIRSISSAGRSYKNGRHGGD